MKIVCACGGSYKSFYLNYFINLKSCDLLIFNFGIIYDYNLENETRGDRIVNKELSMLSKKLNATIVAGVNIIDKESVVFWKRTFQVPCCKERSKRSVIVLFLYSVQINKSWRRSLNSNSFYLREREQIENA